MAAFPERRVSRMAEWARRVSAFSLVLLVNAGVGHRYGLVETVAFLWTMALVAALAVLGLLLAAGGFTQLWRHGAKAGRASLVATLLSVFVLAPYAAGVWFYARLPALTDISTDLEDPPRLIVAARSRTPQMNPVAPVSPQAANLQMRFYPHLTGRRLDAPVDRVLSALGPVIAARGWRVRGTLPASTLAAEISIEMEAPTVLLRYPADAVVRLIDEEVFTYVDMRMASRYASHDLGDNARRIESFLGDLAAELERQSLQIIDIPPSDGNVDPVD